MSSTTLKPSFLELSSRTLILSITLHSTVPIFFILSEVLNLNPFKFASKDSEKKIYQSFVQVDMVALPEEVGLKNKFIDPRLPVVSKPLPAPLPSKAEKEEQNKEAMVLAKKKAQEEARKKEAERRKKEIARKKKAKKLAEAKRKKQEAKAKKKRESERKKALEKLKSEMERDKAIKDLAKNAKEGRTEVRGNRLSKGTATRGQVGNTQEQYLALVESAITSNFNVAPWLKAKGLESVVFIRIGESGRIVERKLIRSSGNPRYDSAVLQAVDLTQKVPPPPKDSAVLTDGVNIRFKPSNWN